MLMPVGTLPVFLRLRQRHLKSCMMFASGWTLLPFLSHCTGTSKTHVSVWIRQLSVCRQLFWTYRPSCCSHSLAPWISPLSLLSAATLFCWPCWRCSPRGFAYQALYHWAASPDPFNCLFWGRVLLSYPHWPWACNVCWASEGWPHPQALFPLVNVMLFSWG